MNLEIRYPNKKDITDTDIIVTISFSVIKLICKHTTWTIVCFGLVITFWVQDDTQL